MRSVELMKSPLFICHPTVQRSCPGNGTMSSFCSQRRTRRGGLAGGCCLRSSRCILLGEKRDKTQGKEEPFLRPRNPSGQRLAATTPQAGSGRDVGILPLFPRRLSQAPAIPR